MRGALFACLLMLSPAAASAAPRSPVVIELYTAQGCGSCTGAGAAMEALAARRDVLPLTFNVDYWDYLGWTDTLARPEFVVRQKTYVSRFKLEDPYTPQAVVGGRGEAGAREAQGALGLRGGGRLGGWTLPGHGRGAREQATSMVASQ